MKKQSGPDIRPEYRLELVSVNSAELASVVAKKFGEILQNAGVEIAIVDNDKKAHSKIVKPLQMLGRNLESKCGQVRAKSKIGLSLLNLPARM